MGQDTVGTLRSFSVEGVPYRVAADANLSEKPSKFENSIIPTSGKGMSKKEKITPTVESVVLIVNPKEKDELTFHADGIEDVKLTYVYANGDTRRCTGVINIESYETNEGRLTLSLPPRDNWTTFLA